MGGARTSVAHIESHWRVVIESLGEGLIVLRANGQIQTANCEAARLLGFTMDEPTGGASTDPSWRAVDEQYRPLDGESHPSWVVLRTNTAVIDCTVGLSLPSGGRRWLR